MADTVARVLVDTPLPQLDHFFDYAIPPELVGSVRPGVRVSIPLRSTGRTAQGWVVETGTDSSFAGQLSPVRAVLSQAIIATPTLFELSRRVADRTAGTASDVLRLAIPRRHVRSENAFLALKRPSVEAQIPARALTAYAPGTAKLLTSRRAKSALTTVPRLVHTSAGSLPHWAITVAELVTQPLLRNESVIIAVPDYRDQRVVEAAVLALIPSERVITVDARQPAGERYLNHLRLAAGGSYVVIGNRSAVLSPIENASLIVMWDDSDPIFEEPHAPGFHARDVALIRAEQTGAALVIARHTPSLEVRRFMQLGWFDSVTPLRLTRPNVILDEQNVHPGLSSLAFTTSKEAIRHGPVLLQVANPGFSRSAMCRSCHVAARCRVCAGALYFATKSAAPLCRVCGTRNQVWSCSACNSSELTPVGAAASRTAEELGKAFPGVPVVIADGAHPVLTVPDEPALIVATRGAEPIAEGGYRAVVLLDAARMLAREGLQVAEDAIRAWTTAAGLANDGAPVFLPNCEGTLAKAFASWSFDAWAQHELTERHALRLPPSVRVATVAGNDHALTEVRRIVQSLSELGRIDIYGPLPVDGDVEQLSLRYDHRAGAALAVELKALMVKVATTTRKRSQTKDQHLPASVRVRMDDPEVFA